MLPPLLEMRGIEKSFPGVRAVARGDFDLRCGEVQDFNLVPALSARENIFRGRQSTRTAIIARKEERRAARSLFRRLDADIDPETPCRNLTARSNNWWRSPRPWRKRPASS